MKVQKIKGLVDRIFFHVEAKLLYIKLTDVEEVYELRVSPLHNKSIMLTKPMDVVTMHIQNGHLDKWDNETLGPI